MKEIMCVYYLHKNDAPEFFAISFKMA